MEVARVTRGPIILVQSLHSSRLGLCVASRPRVRLDHRGLPRFEVPRLCSCRQRSSRMQTRRFYSAEALQRELDDGRVAGPIAARAAIAAWRRPGRRRMERQSAMTETSSLLRDSCAKRASADRRGRRGHSRECGSSVGRLAATISGSRILRSRSSWRMTAARTPPRPSWGPSSMTPACAWSLASAGLAPRRAMPGPQPAPGGCSASSMRTRSFRRMPSIAFWSTTRTRAGAWCSIGSSRASPGSAPGSGGVSGGMARLLPIARAKSMPAFMSCDRAHFERYGPFNESCAIAEEWPLTVAAYRHHRDRFLYDRSLTARTSSRRMELQTFGYLRTYREVGLGGPLPLGAHLAHRCSTRDRQSMMATRVLPRVSGAGLAAPIGQVHADSDRPSERPFDPSRASGSPRAESSGDWLSGWCESAASFYAPLLIWMGGLVVKILDTGAAGARPTGVGGAGAADLPDGLRHFDSGRGRRDAGAALPRWTDPGDVAGGSGRWTSRSGRRRSNARSSPWPSSIAWDSRTRTPWPRTCSIDLEAGVGLTGSTSKPFMIRAAHWHGGVPTTCERCSSPVSSEPFRRSAPKRSSSSWMSTRTKTSPAGSPAASHRCGGARSASTSPRRHCPFRVFGKSAGCCKNAERSCTNGNATIPSHRHRDGRARAPASIGPRADRARQHLLEDQPRDRRHCRLGSSDPAPARASSRGRGRARPQHIPRQPSRQFPARCTRLLARCCRSRSAIRSRSSRPRPASTRFTIGCGSVPTT